MQGCKLVNVLTSGASLTLKKKKINFQLCRRYKGSHREELHVSGGEHIKADDGDTCLVEFRLTKFSRETSVEGRGCSGEAVLRGPPQQQDLIFLIRL